MKLLVAAASFSPNISGIQRHGLNLARCLLLLPEISELHFVVAPWQRAFVQAAGLPPDPRLRIHSANISPGSLSRNLWSYFGLPRLARQLHVDVVHLSFPMPIRASALSCSSVVTLHDMYPYEIPANFGFSKSFFNRATLRRCLGAVDAIACVSNATRMRLAQFMPPAICRKAIHIPNCVEMPPPPSIQSPLPDWEGTPFLLCVAQHRRNKNIATLIRAFGQLRTGGWITQNCKLLVVGIRGPETAHLHRLVSRSGLAGSVRFLEGLSEPDLQWCYRNCELLVAPSLTEGFGLPVAEGLLAGCRIVCSDIPAHREVAEGRCRFVNLLDKPAETLAAVLADALRQPRPIPVAVSRFSSHALAPQYLSLYSSLLQSAVSELAESVAGSIGMVASERQQL
jgi:glycosyltransferase involved in cell wall biosynthesis